MPTPAPTDCAALAAQIEAETDEFRKAELQAQYARECSTEGGGPKGPPPKVLD